MTDSWPPPYTIRVNKRTKHIHLQISPAKGLQIIIPSKRTKKDALEFLQKKRSWVERNLQQINFNNPQAIILPDTIELPALSQRWHVKYQSTQEKQKPQLITVNPNLILYGDLTDQKMCRELLFSWLKSYAEKYLIAWLTDLAKKNQFEVNQIKIRAQQTRWGSCSYKKNIYLNFKLLFLPNALVEYVLIHELCHTVHFDHSEKFWQLLESYIEDHRAIRKELRQISKYIPSWVMDD